MLLNPNINLEFVVIITATIESTGTTYQCKRSYINTDIKFGHKFGQCIFRENNEYVVDYDCFDSISKIENFDTRSMEMRTENHNHSNFTNEMSTPRKQAKMKVEDIFLDGKLDKLENSGLEDSVEKIPLLSSPDVTEESNSGSRKSRFTIEKIK